MYVTWQGGWLAGAPASGHRLVWGAFHDAPAKDSGGYRPQAAAPVQDIRIGVFSLRGHLPPPSAPAGGHPVAPSLPCGVLSRTNGSAPAALVTSRVAAAELAPTSLFGCDCGSSHSSLCMFFWKVSTVSAGRKTASACRRDTP